ncbi:hypothetical protein UlMin_035992 [Ulmus minor]
MARSIANIDGLSRKSVSYNQLPDEPLKLSVLKLDGSCFNVEVTKNATVAELKQAVEATFSHMPQKGPGKISWPHVWGHFCLSYAGVKLVIDTDYVRDYGVKDGDQVSFIRHISISYNLIKKRPKRGSVASKQQGMSESPSMDSSEEEENEEYSDCNDMENKKVHRYYVQGAITKHETRWTRLLREWFSYSRIASFRGMKIKTLARPKRVTTGFLGGFKKIVQLCGAKCYRRKPSSLLCCDQRHPQRDV